MNLLSWSFKNNKINADKIERLFGVIPITGRPHNVCV